MSSWLNKKKAAREAAERAELERLMAEEQAAWDNVYKPDVCWFSSRSFGNINRVQRVIWDEEWWRLPEWSDLWQIDGLAVVDAKKAIRRVTGDETSEPENRWTLTHMRSGLLIAASQEANELTSFIRACQDYSDEYPEASAFLCETDWTRDGPTLTATADQQQLAAYRELRTQYDCVTT